MEDEIIIKIRLPKEIQMHVPTFGDKDASEILNVIDVLPKAKEFIYKTIEDRFLEAFTKKHEKIIGEAVGRLMEEKEDDILELLGLNKK